jgi:hypothetical protein
MIKITVTQHSENGNFTGFGKVSIDYSEKINALEVGALWDVIKEGRFERQAKTLLEELCANKGFNSVELLG